MLLTICALATSTGINAQQTSKVYLLRGLADVSTGLDDLAAKLRRRGISAQVGSYTVASEFAERAIRDYKANHAPIVIIGHSLGADASLAMAERLRQARVPVALIVTFSAAKSIDVPSNVGRVVNYFQSNSVWNISYRAAPGSRTSVRNVDLARDASIHHFNIEKVERLHTTTVTTILGLAGVGPATQKPKSAKSVAEPAGDTGPGTGVAAE
ncbi:MAG: hypothetical protein ACKVP7_07865 [Hyphomicrobiaceae bacterium]